MSDIKTIAGVFSINTCKLPESYICNKKPAVTYENGVCEITTYDQQVVMNGQTYAPILHQSCMHPDEITVYPLVICQMDDALTITDHYHTGSFQKGKSITISKWQPQLKRCGCFPCRNCGRC